MILRRSDSGCRGKVRIFPLLLALLLAVLVSGDSLTTAATEDKSSSDSSTISTVVVSTTTVDDAQETTLSDEEITKRDRYCRDVNTTDTLQTIGQICSTYENEILAKTPLDISQEREENIKSFFSLFGKRIDIDFIISNSPIQTLDFGNMKFIGYFDEAHTSLVLTNNKNLNKIIALRDLQFRGGIVVRGNRHLTKEQIEQINKWTRKKDKKDVQLEKECFQDEDNDFAGCERIYGDLTLKDFEQPKTPFILKAITGCLTLENTKKNVEEISLSINEFLSKLEENQAANCGGTSSISNYCVKRDIQDKIKEKFQKGQKISFTDHNNCAYECTEDDILKRAQTNCKIINGPLSVTGEYTDKQLELLHSVKIVNGEVLIDGTKEPHLGFLLNLEEIHSTNPNVPVIRIVNNEKADQFGFKLKNVTSEAKEKFVFENNGFNCTETDKVQLERLLNVDFVKCGIEKVEPKIVPNKPEKTEETSQQQTNSGDNAKKDSANDNSLGGGAIAGIVTAAIAGVLILIVAAVVCVYFFVIKPKKKKNNKVDKVEPKVDIVEPKPTPIKKPIIVKKKLNEEQEEEEKIVNNLITKIVEFKYVEQDPEGKNIEKQEPGAKNIEKQDPEGKNIEKQEPGAKKIEKQDSEGKNIEKQEPGAKKIEKQDSEEKGAEDKLGYVLQFEAIQNYKLDKRKTSFNPVFLKNMKLNCGIDAMDLFEETRVKLSKYKDEIAKLEQSKDKNLDPDYIHANFVDFKKYDYNQVFIATTCPMVKNEDSKKLETTERFFAMVFEQNVRMIIAIDTSVQDGGYFSMNVGTKEGELFDVKTIKVDVNPNFNVRTLEITHKSSKEKKTIPHLELLHWPDGDQPNVDLKGYIPPLYKFVEEQKDEKSPILVHCKAGVGRTGILILCFFIVHYFNANALKTLEPKFDEWFKHIRDQRYNAVQAWTQYLMMPAMFLTMLEGKCTNEDFRKKITAFLQKYKESASQ